MRDSNSPSTGSDTAVRSALQRYTVPHDIVVFARWIDPYLHCTQILLPLCTSYDAVSLARMACPPSECFDPADYA